MTCSPDWWWSTWECCETSATHLIAGDGDPLEWVSRHQVLTWLLVIYLSESWDIRYSPDCWWSTWVSRETSGSHLIAGDGDPLEWVVRHQVLTWLLVTHLSESRDIRYSPDCWWPTWVSHETSGTHLIAGDLLEWVARHQVLTRLLVIYLSVVKHQVLTWLLVIYLRVLWNIRYSPDCWWWWPTWECCETSGTHLIAGDLLESVVKHQVLTWLLVIYLSVVKHQVLTWLLVIYLSVVKHQVLTWLLVMVTHLSESRDIRYSNDSSRLGLEDGLASPLPSGYWNNLKTILKSTQRKFKQ